MFSGAVSHLLRQPWVLALQYLTLAAAIGAGLYVIRRGLIIEPPAFITDWLAALTERLGRRFVTS